MDLHELGIWMLESLPFDIFLLDQEGNLVYANTKAAKSLKYKPKELIGMSIMDINPQTTPQSWQKHWQIVAQEGLNYFQTFHVQKTGQERPVEVFAQIFSNNRKKFICSLIRDLSESNFYRELLEETENAAEVGGWQWDLAEDRIYATREALQMFEAPDVQDLHPERLRAMLEGIPGEQPTEWAQAQEALLQEGKAYDMVIHCPHYPGGERWFRSTGRALKGRQQTLKIMGTYQDITRYKSLEHSLQLAQQTIGHTRDMMYWINQEAHIVRTNAAVCDELGYTREEILGKKIFDIDPTFPKNRWKKHWEEIKEKKTFTFETHHQRANGTLVTVEIKANYLHYEGKEYNCAIVRDITERKQREVALVQALSEIKALKKQIEAENEYLQEEIHGNLNLNFEGIISQSKAYQKVLSQVQQVADSEATVLITGETGTGKELIARAIHQNSPRKDRPLIKVNCAALPRDLIESELFGHKRGAFTGAIHDKLGRFALADGGTLFLDEIGELPLDLQPKLLRVLQEGEYDRLGDTQTTRVDVRILAATNRKLEVLIQEGKFRADLFYRLNVFPIHNLPLRERREDIPLLAQYFLEKYAKKSGKDFRRISKKTLKQLALYSFPGNIRELENLIERAILLEPGPTLFPGAWFPETKAPRNAPAELQTLEAVQKEHILRVLVHTQGRVSGDKGAARILGMHDKTLFARMKKLGIRKEDYVLYKN